MSETDNNLAADLARRSWYDMTGLVNGLYDSLNVAQRALLCVDQFSNPTPAGAKPPNPVLVNLIMAFRALDYLGPFADLPDFIKMAAELLGWRQRDFRTVVGHVARLRDEYVRKYSFAPLPEIWPENLKVLLRLVDKHQDLMDNPPHRFEDTENRQKYLTMTKEAFLQLRVHEIGKLLCQPPPDRPAFPRQNMDWLKKRVTVAPHPRSRKKELTFGDFFPQLPYGPKPRPEGAQYPQADVEVMGDSSSAAGDVFNADLASMEQAGRDHEIALDTGPLATREGADEELLADGRHVVVKEPAAKSKYPLLGRPHI